MTAVVTCSYERQNARDAGIQTYNLGRIAVFRDTGGKLDRSVAAFNDAIAKGSDPAQAKVNVQTALAEHASVVQAMLDVFGQGVPMYMADLKRLNRSVEGCSDPTCLPAIIRNLATTIMRREAMASEASQRSLPK